MCYKFFKRIFDIIASIVAIGFFLLPWLIISVIITIQSPGPVLYKPERVGKNGKSFTLYKFRTMRVDSGSIHVTTLRSDPRIFPFGSFLRKSKLDETPQLINILKGNMSVIGPRPEDKNNADKLFSDKYFEILSVKPGLSSPASLFDYTHGELYETEEDYIRDFVPTKIELELYYVRHRCMMYDFQIIGRTILTIIQILLGKKDFILPKEINNISLH